MRTPMRQPTWHRTQPRSLVSSKVAPMPYAGRLENDLEKRSFPTLGSRCRVCLESFSAYAIRPACSLRLVRARSSLRLFPSLGSLPWLVTEARTVRLRPAAALRTNRPEETALAARLALQVVETQPPARRWAGRQSAAQVAEACRTAAPSTAVRLRRWAARRWVAIPRSSASIGTFDAPPSQ